jgi:hypothetical protein
MYGSQLSPWEQLWQLRQPLEALEEHEQLAAQRPRFVKPSAPETHTAPPRAQASPTPPRAPAHPIVKATKAAAPASAADEVRALLATRPDFCPLVRAAVASASLDQVREAVATWPRASTVNASQTRKEHNDMPTKTKTLDEVKEDLQAVADDDDSTDEEKRKAKRALAALDEKEREEKARAAWASLSPGDQARRIEAAHAEQVSRSRLDAEENELLAKTDPRRSKGTTRVTMVGTTFSMPQQPPDPASAARRLEELDAELARGSR